MRLVACEWRKLLGVRTLWAFVALCLAYNALISLPLADRSSLFC